MMIRNCRYAYNIWSFTRKTKIGQGDSDTLNYLTTVCTCLAQVNGLTVDPSHLERLTVTTSYRTLTSLIEAMEAAIVDLVANSNFTKQPFEDYPGDYTGKSWFRYTDNLAPNIAEQLDAFNETLERLTFRVNAAVSKHNSLNMAEANQRLLSRLLPLAKEVSEILDITLILGGLNERHAGLINRGQN